MRKTLALLLFILCFSNALSQTLIRRDDMETPTTWRGSSTTGANSSFVGGFSLPTDNPPNYQMYSSLDTCYRVVGSGLGSSSAERDTFIYPNVTVPTGRPYQMRFRLASFGLNPGTQTAAGVDQTDWFELQYSVNNGLSWWRDAQIQGISNSMWSFDGAINTGAKLTITRTGSVSTTTPTIYVSNAGNPITDVSVNIPFTNITQIRIRFVTNINATGETFMLDDVEIWDMTIPLPIELVYFRGSCENGKTRLEWSTASETNNDHFSVYHSSDGLNFELEGTLLGSGNSSTSKYYDFESNGYCNGLVYYKICQIDYDGKSECFEPIAIFCRGNKPKSIVGIRNILGQEVDEFYEGTKILIFEDGSAKKTN